MNCRMIILFLLVLTVGDCKRETGNSRLESARVQPVGLGVCNADFDLNDAITNKLSSENYEEGNQTSKGMLELSKKSSECRGEIVRSLMQAMDQTNLNFVSDRRSYYLWARGSVILGQLKAVESLDLLINHLDLNDGQFSASMVHQPAVHGVEKMGAQAVPKLNIALRENSNRNIRLAVAWCLFDISGQDATDALKQALKSESDPCVRRFIELNFETPTEEVLKERLLAFRCGN